MAGQTFRELSGIISVSLLLTSHCQPNDTVRFVAKCQTVIERVAGRLIQEKKRKIAEAEEKGQVYQGKDLLSLLCESPNPCQLFSEG